MCEIKIKMIQLRFVCHVLCAGMKPERAGSFVEVRKRSARGKAMEVIDVEPLVSIEPKGKGAMPPLKRKMKFSTPMEGKLMFDAIKITRTSRRLAGLRPPIMGGSSSTGVSKGTQASKVIKREGAAEAVYMLYWNVGKMCRLISVDETKE